MNFRLGMASIVLFWSVLPASAEESPEKLTFESQIRPILKAHCFDCHGAEEELRGGLDLRLRRFMVKGGDSGAAIVPGDPDSSYLLDRIRNGEMPPNNAHVSPEEIAIIERWIATGAETARPEPETLGKGIRITPEERTFWSFQPLRRPDVPQFAEKDRVRTPIDAFLLEAMRPHGLSFSPDADKLTLMRRAYFDLIGLPPTPEEVHDFLADTAPGAYERLIDQLLQSPHYGERWGRHWLDVAGYADSEGYTNEDPVREYAYKYRDYVVRSFNADKPFDQFIQEQLAGDEMVSPPYKNLEPDEIEKLVATGFLRMAADGTGSGKVDQQVARHQVVADTIQIVSTSLLGLSVACAQCHNHRYDPIPQDDYYSLWAIFAPALDVQRWRTPQERRISLYTDADRQQAAEIEAQVAKVAAEKKQKQEEYMAAALEQVLAEYDESLRESLREAYRTPAKERTAEQKQLLDKYPNVNIHPGVLYQYNPKAAEDLKEYDQQMAAIRAKKPVEDFLRALTEIPEQVPETRLLHRGDPKQPQEIVAPAALSITAPPGQRAMIVENDPERPTTGRRLAYARWLTSGEHPLVGRVLANRVWMHHFGRGIVGTPDDFGRLGETPTHPELLDWLAREFVRNNWSLKAFHRLIMTSTVYRQSSFRDPEKETIDPSNFYYWHWPVQRLDAEVIRDRALAASGTLERDMFGPSVPVKADDTGQIIAGEGKKRRSLYIQARRSQPVALLAAFDAPVMQTNCTRRSSSTVATQSLMLMNGEFLLDQADRFAQRVLREASQTPLSATGNEPTAASQRSASPWRFGYGQFDERTQSVSIFEEFPHWTGNSWQGGPALPDSRIGWALLRARGGHPGNDPQHAAIRRWTAPQDGTLTIQGQLQHSSEKGDGVRGRIVSSRSGLAGEWGVQNEGTETFVRALEIRQGDTIDFITDCRDSVGYDSFDWIVELRLRQDDGKETHWKSQDGFHGPPPPSLSQQVAYAWQLAFARTATRDELAMSLKFLKEQIDFLKAQEAVPADSRETANPSEKVNPELQALTNYCQILMSSNEFLYTD